MGHPTLARASAAQVPRTLFGNDLDSHLQSALLHASDALHERTARLQTVSSGPGAQPALISIEIRADIAGRKKLLA